MHAHASSITKRALLETCSFRKNVLFWSPSTPVMFERHCSYVKAHTWHKVIRAGRRHAGYMTHGRCVSSISCALPPLCARNEIKGIADFCTSCAHIVIVMAATADDVHFKYTLRADERSRMFKPGYRFPNAMTYKELCAFVSLESHKAGFDPLRPKVVSKLRMLDYVKFYCVHAREHPNQSRKAKGLEPATSKRADRSDEATRCLFTSCEFEMRVRRSDKEDVAAQMSHDELIQFNC